MNDMPVNSEPPSKRCWVCGDTEFESRAVLWPELIASWQLSPHEVEYIDRQQGFHCKNCGNNLRSIALAAAILRSYGFKGTLDEFCCSPVAEKLNVLEINPAGSLTKHLKAIPRHRLVCYPEFDMTNMQIPSGSIDLIVHSDTLEHVVYPDTAMAECRRVLKPSGRCIFTIPIVVGRMSRSRMGLPDSFHGSANNAASDLLVHTEFGVDFWKVALEAGFQWCAIHSIEFPAGLAIEARP